MPIRCDAGRLYAAVASLECQRCGRHGIHGDRGILRRIKADEPALLADVIELLSKE